LDFISVQSFRNGSGVITNVAYPDDKLCVISTVPSVWKLMISVTNSGKTVCYAPENSETDAPREFVEMLKSGKAPRDYSFYTKSVELMSKICETAGM
jgi:hypothetical protein